jgi:hypothetical protein
MPIETFAFSVPLACPGLLRVCCRLLSRPRLLVRLSALPREGVPRSAVLKSI